MSTALAIASVTAVLKDLLNTGLISNEVSAKLGNVTVSATSPDRIDITNSDQPSQLNLFLYQVTPNASWRNVGLASRNADGERLTNPPLALNLHYLLTAYGAAELHAEILLGFGMQFLHETPVLTRKAIRTSLAQPSQGGATGDLLQYLFSSELAEQVEQIKIVPETPNTEEISRLWSALGSHYRPTAAYQASVVLIEKKLSTKSALPVRSRNIYVNPFKQPVIEEIRSQAKPGDPILINQPITTGQRLVIVGSDLRADDVVVRIGGIERAPLPDDISDTQIIVAIPTQLQAGVQGVQVIQRALIGTPPLPHRGVESNLAAFVLQPTVDSSTVGFTGTVGPRPVSGTVVVSVAPPVGDQQRVVLLLNELVPLSSPPAETPSESFSFVAPSRILSPPVSPPGTRATIGIPIQGVKARTYLVRLQVDGAESPLEADANGRYNAPKVTIA